MSEVLDTVGKVAGIVATVAAPLSPGVAAVAAVVSGAATIGARITAPKPRVLGSATSVTIGADQPQPYMMGDTYCGGARQLQVAYGGTIDDVPNPYAAIVDVYSAGGPIEAIDAYYTDFNEVTFAGSPTGGSAANATGFYNSLLYVQASLGAWPQGSALAPNWSSAPGWGSSARISGKAHALWNLKWDKRGGKFNAGVPQLGMRGRGVRAHDPRADDSYPGGEGESRWADPADTAAFDAATGTWPYTASPALHALRYALGSWERDTGDADSVYQLTFGIGFPIDAIVLEDVVDWANVCDLNGWEISGVIYEPGSSKWENLLRICAAGGATPVPKGGRLGFKVHAPRVSLDTITMDDLADGDPEVAGYQRWQERANTVIAKCKSPSHKWKLQQVGRYAVADYLAADGEARVREEAFECVKDATQAAQLAAYSLFDSREAGPATLPVKPRLRGFFAGDRLTLSPELAAYLGWTQREVTIGERQFDPASMSGELALVTETLAKHALALAATGSEPAAIVLPTPEEFDGSASADPSGLQYQVLNSWTTGLTVTASDVGSDATVNVSAHTRDYLDGTTATLEAGAITGLAFGTQYFIAYDDPGREGGAVTYVAYSSVDDAGPAAAHPGRHYLAQVTTPVDGGGDTSGPGGGIPPWKFPDETSP